VHYIAGITTALVGIGIIWVGARYLLAPEASARTFGLPAWPSGQALAWCNLKGVRDIGTGLVTFVVLGMASWHVVAWCLLALAVIPLGDGITVLRYRGSTTMAYAVHWATAWVRVVDSALLLFA
jgi:hypothetical protein